jgi:hypothetical protein
MNQVLEHKKTGWKFEIVPLTQGHAEDYYKALRELRPAEASALEVCGASVRAAAKAGWFVEVTVEAVRAMTPPAQVIWLAGKINQINQEITKIPPE